jgi:hypothetical protein
MNNLELLKSKNAARTRTVTEPPAFTGLDTCRHRGRDQKTKGQADSAPPGALGLSQALVMRARSQAADAKLVSPAQLAPGIEVSPGAAGASRHCN